MFADTIAFVLPRCFNKYTFQNRINRSFHLKFFKNISGNFDYEGDKKEVSVVFQIWEKSDKIRALVKPQSTHRHFLMRHAHMSRTSSFERKLLIDFADIAIPQVGARFKPANPSSIDKGSHWFIKFLDGADKSAFNRLDFDFLDGQNTAHKSLSKSDIVRAYQVAIGDSVENECLSLKVEPEKPKASEQLDLVLKCDYDSIKRIRKEVA